MKCESIGFIELREATRSLLKKHICGFSTLHSETSRLNILFGSTSAFITNRYPSNESEFNMNAHKYIYLCSGTSTLPLSELNARMDFLPVQDALVSSLSSNN